ncbi:MULTISPECIES: plasmid segregation protein ParM domain-containing protein [Bacillus cereus group]|uniref:ParM/StbA family protein n=1 Tax=Bacillus cereus group TaxID=86661 RepID=UPI001021D214|nr:plasmid segregation protein ParM domain-containing protein [Bacillus albus]
MRKVLVIDHGNGNIKMRSEISKGVLPSILAFKRDVGDSFLSKKALKLNTYEVNGKEYVWGKDVTKVKDVFTTFGFQNRYTEPLFKDLTSIALADLAKKSNITATDEVVVITGVPSNEINKEAANQLKEAFEGLHVVKIDGKTVKVNIEEVVILPQPIGTVMGQYLDENGYVENEKYEEIRVGVIDIGTGTTDLDSINALRRENEFKSLETGMKHVYQLIADYINNKNSNAKVEYYHIEPFFEKGEYKISERHIIDFKEVKEQAVFTVSERIKQGIKNAWGTFDRFDEIIVTGGGAELFAADIQNLVGSVKISTNPQQANADGFFKYGMFKVSEEDGE